MAETHEIVFQGRDRVTPALRQVTSGLTRLRDENGRFIAAGRQTTASLGRLQTSASGLHRALSTLPPIAARVGSSLGRMGREGAAAAQSASTAMEQMRTRANSLSATLSGAFRNSTLAMGGLLAAVTGAVGKTGVEMNVSVTGATAALARISGSAPLATKLIRDLRQEARTSASTFEDMLGPAQSLAAVFVQRYGPQGLGRVIPTLRAFSDAAVSLKVGTMGQENALYGFRQLASSPNPTLEDIKQIDEALPGAGVRNIVRAAFGSDEAEVLKEANISGARVAEAIVAGLQRKFGGAQQSAAKTLPILSSGFLDTFNDLSARVTEGLGARLRDAAEGFSTLLERFSTSQSGANFLNQLSAAFENLGRSVIFAVQKFPAIISQAMPLLTGFVQGVANVTKAFFELAGSQKLISGLLAPFHAIGNAIGAASAQAGGFVKWLEQIVNQQNVAQFFGTMGSLLQTIVTQVGRLIGIDLGKVFKPESVMGFFQALHRGVEDGVRAFFGMGRVMQEIGRIMRSTWESIGLKIGDTLQDVRTWFQRTFVDSTAGMRRMVADFLSSVRTALDGMRAALEPFRELLGRTGKIMLEALGDAVRGLGVSIGSLQQINPFKPDAATEARYRKEDADTATARRMRDRQRLMEDPHLNDPWGKRIADAFRGRNERGDMDAQIGFFREWEANKAGWRGMFGPGAIPGAPSPGPASPFAPVPQMGPDLRRLPSVSLAPTGPAIPAFPGGGFLPHHAIQPMAQGMPYVEGPGGGFTFPAIPPGQTFRQQQAPTQDNRTLVIQIGGMTREQVMEQIERAYDKFDQEASYGRRR